jgi:hypothetical protein
LNGREKIVAKNGPCSLPWLQQEHDGMWRDSDRNHLALAYMPNMA